MAGLLALVASTASSQTPTLARTKYAVEVVTRDRWMNARQQPLNTPTTTATTWIHIDSTAVDSAANTRLLWAQTGIVNAGDPAFISTTLDGRVRAISASLRPRTPLPVVVAAGDTARMTRLRVASSAGDRLNLPESRVWELVPSFRPARLVAGTRWVDTISLSATFGDMRQSLTGVRTSVLVRDTVVAGRTLWIVRDSAMVRYEDRITVDERRLDSLSTIDRRVAGVIAGRSLHDPSVGLNRARSDSTLLRGDAVLRYPDGRVFTSPTTFERSRTWAMYEVPAELAARQAAIRAQRDSNAFSIVSVPRNALEERVSAGDQAIVDSLFAAWEASRDADQRAAIAQLLSRARRDSSVIPRLDRLRIAQGDTALLFNQSARGYPGGRLTVAHVQFLLPLMRDPGLAFQYGVSRDVAYEGMIETLMRRPPALEPDTAKWLCEPAACRLLGEQWTASSEPRLKSVGLSVLALVDPRRWRDTFLAHAATGDNVSRLAQYVVAGYGANPVFPAAARTATLRPIPDVGADWTAWRTWLGIPATPAPPAVPLPPGAVPRPPAWMTTRGNANGIRMVQVATGRNIVGELRSLYASAPNDTARTLVGTLLVTLGEPPLAADSMAAYIRNGSELMRLFALQHIENFTIDAPQPLRFAPVDSATNDAMQGRLLTGMAEGTEPWRTLEERQAGRAASPFRNPPTDASPNARLPVSIASDRLSAALRGMWNTRVSFISGAEWSAKPLREGGELWSISNVDRAGPFLRVAFNVSGRIARQPQQAPQAWGSGTTYYLMDVDGEWVIVKKSVWVT